MLVDARSGAACTCVSRDCEELRAGDAYSVRACGSDAGVAALRAAYRQHTARLRRSPDDAKAWAARAACNLLLGRPHLAAADAMASQNLDAFAPCGYMLVAEACLAMGGAAEARVHCLNGLAADAAHPRLHRVLQMIEDEAVTTAHLNPQPELRYPLHAVGGSVWLAPGGGGSVRTDAMVGRALAAQTDRLHAKRVPGAGLGVFVAEGESFEPAEVLFVDVPHISVCLDSTCCQLCMKPVATEAAAACEACAEVYCSEGCRRRAWDSFHSVQCGEVAKRVAACQRSLLAAGKDIGQNYHVLTAVRQSGIILAAAAQAKAQRGETDEVDESGEPWVDTLAGVSHLVGMGKMVILSRFACCPSR